MDSMDFIKKNLGSSFISQTPTGESYQGRSITRGPDEILNQVRPLNKVLAQAINNVITTRSLRLPQLPGMSTVQKAETAGSAASPTSTFTPRLTKFFGNPMFIYPNQGFMGMPLYSTLMPGFSAFAGNPMSPFWGYQLQQYMNQMQSGGSQQPRATGPRPQPAAPKPVQLPVEDTVKISSNTATEPTKAGPSTLATVGKAALGLTTGGITGAVAMATPGLIDKLGGMDIDWSSIFNWGGSTESMQGGISQLEQKMVKGELKNSGFAQKDLDSLKKFYNNNYEINDKIAQAEASDNKEELKELNLQKAKLFLNFNEDLNKKQKNGTTKKDKLFNALKEAGVEDATIKEFEASVGNMEEINKNLKAQVTGDIQELAQAVAGKEAEGATDVESLAKLAGEYDLDKLGESFGKLYKEIQEKEKAGESTPVGSKEFSKVLEKLEQFKKFDELEAKYKAAGDEDKLKELETEKMKFYVELNDIMKQEDEQGNTLEKRLGELIKNSEALTDEDKQQMKETGETFKEQKEKYMENYDEWKLTEEGRAYEAKRQAQLQESEAKSMGKATPEQKAVMEEGNRRFSEAVERYRQNFTGVERPDQIDTFRIEKMQKSYDDSVATFEQVFNENSHNPEYDPSSQQTLLFTMSQEITKYKQLAQLRNQEKDKLAEMENLQGKSVDRDKYKGEKLEFELVKLKNDREKIVHEHFKLKNKTNKTSAEKEKEKSLKRQAGLYDDSEFDVDNMKSTKMIRTIEEIDETEDKKQLVSRQNK
ncbi:MAG: hypothetical protein ACLFQV_09515 [Vulcanimicrobiota bacterium]